MPQSKPKSHVNQQIQINDLARDIETIKDNHLVHLEMSVMDLKQEVKDNKDHFNSRIDRLDNRIFWVLGLTVSTLASVIASMVV